MLIKKRQARACLSDAGITDEEEFEEVVVFAGVHGCSDEMRGGREETVEKWTKGRCVVISGSGGDLRPHPEDAARHAKSRHRYHPRTYLTLAIQVENNCRRLESFENTSVESSTI